MRDDQNGASLRAGACQIAEYLETVVRSPDLRPPDAPGVYVISEQPWREMPSKTSGILYVGQAMYLRRRIGQLLCDLMGFTGDEYSDRESYEHRGGHRLWHCYCLARGVEPSSLYVGWCSQCLCLDCAEAKIREMMDVRWNLYPTRSCDRHVAALEVFSN
jgi:hypothetical protein